MTSERLRIGDQIGLKELLDHYYNVYNTGNFIDKDPILIPKSYTLTQDIEITAFWTAILSWGNRTTIINKSRALFGMMGSSPYKFIVESKPSDLREIGSFVHRTFNGTDALYFIYFLKHHFERYESLEEAFIDSGKFVTIEDSLCRFRSYFFSLEHLHRTTKHISSPDSGSTCKRLNMFLRWLVRTDQSGVDFGIWKRIPSAALMMPLDVHVERIGRELGFITRKQRDWKTVVELTESLRIFDPEDPVKYDFALFGMGLSGAKFVRH